MFSLAEFRARHGERLCVNLSFLNSVRVLGVDAFLHEACRRQKQPCTKMTHVFAGIQNVRCREASADEDGSEYRYRAILPGRPTQRGMLSDVPPIKARFRPRHGKINCLLLRFPRKVIDRSEDAWPVDLTWVPR